MNMNIQSLMREAQKMQKNLEKTQNELTSTEYEGSSSCVKVVLNGNKDVKSIKIDSNDIQKIKQYLKRISIGGKNLFNSAKDKIKSKFNSMKTKMRNNNNNHYQIFKKGVL